MPYQIDPSTGRRVFVPELRRNPAGTSLAAQVSQMFPRSGQTTGEYLMPDDPQVADLERMAQQKFGRTTDLPQDDPLVQYMNQRGYGNLNPASNYEKQMQDNIRRNSLATMNTAFGGGAGGAGATAGGSTAAAPALPGRTDLSSLLSAANWRPPALAAAPGMPAAPAPPGRIGPPPAAPPWQPQNRPPPAAAIRSLLEAKQTMRRPGAGSIEWQRPGGLQLPPSPLTPTGGPIVGGVNPEIAAFVQRLQGGRRQA